MADHLDRYECEGGEVVLRSEDQQWGGVGFVYIVQAIPKGVAPFVVYQGTSISNARKIFRRECNYMKRRVSA